MLKLRISKAKKLLKKLYYSKIPAILVGSTGVGKTAIISQLVEELKEETNQDIDLVIFRLSHEAPENIGGIPRPSETDKEAFEKILSSKLLRVIRRRSVLFLDELNRAPLWSQNVAMNIIFERDIDGRRLHEETYVVAAINSGSRFLGTFEVDPATLARFAVINVLPDIHSANEALKKDFPDQVAALEPLADGYQNFLDKYASFDAIEPEFTTRHYQFLLTILRDYSGDEDLRDLLLAVAPGEVVDYTLSNINFEKIERIVKGEEVEIERSELPVLLAVLSGWNFKNAEELLNALKFAKEITDRLQLNDSFAVFVRNLKKKHKDLMISVMDRIFRLIPDFGTIFRQ
jgi:GTPase SAR1 family protein